MSRIQSQIVLDLYRLERRLGIFTTFFSLVAYFLRMRHNFCCKFEVLALAGIMNRTLLSWKQDKRMLQEFVGIHSFNHSLEDVGI